MLRRISKSKRGFYFYAELLIVVILVTVIWLQFQVSQQSYVDLAEQENLRYVGYTGVKALDLMGILPKYINQTNFSATNFTTLNAYITNSFPTTMLITAEYIINATTCYNASGSIKTCGLNTTLADTTSVIYTFTNSTEPISVKLYLKNLFGGHL